MVGNNYTNNFVDIVIVKGVDLCWMQAQDADVNDYFSHQRQLLSTYRQNIDSNVTCLIGSGLLAEQSQHDHRKASDSFGS